MRNKTKDKTKTLKKVQLLRKALQLQYPNIFSSRGKQIPLSLTIKTELRAAYPGLTAKVLQSFLWFWCSRYFYLKNLAESKPGSRRVHLDGTPAEPIGTRARKRAKELLVQLERHSLDSARKGS